MFRRGSTPVTTLAAHYYRALTSLTKGDSGLAPHEPLGRSIGAYHSRLDQYHTRRVAHDMRRCARSVASKIVADLKDADIYAPFDPR